MMRIERTTDASIICSVASRHDIRPFISDDHCGPDFVPVINPGLYWLAAYGEELAGIFMAHPWNGSTYEVHACLLPAYRGKQGREAAKAMQAWLFTQTPCQKLVALVPSMNERALRLARDTGFQDEGLCRKSFLRNGYLHDQLLLGLTREEWQSCP